MDHKAQHAHYKRLVDKMDPAVRDIEIRAMWEGLSYADLKYKDKLDILSQKYYVSEKVVEHALNEIPKTEQV